jgi:threonylcarbamoyladenosine tRNA methylthiotransferase MtaB
MANAVLLKSIGCRTNQEEMAALASLLACRGHSVVERLEDADIVIVNTCFVTSTTEAKTRRYISALSRARPGIKICVTGCLAQHSPLEIKRRLPVTWVVGNGFKKDIPSILDDRTGGVFHGDVCSPQSRSLSLVNIPTRPGARGRTRFFLKIQEGCDCRCSYCVVPQVRGPSVSAAFSDVRAAFGRAVDAGYKEIVLTGTHIGHYADAASGSLADLAAALVESPGDFRVRLSSLDPRELSDSLLEMIGKHPKLCRHLHLSVQSFSSEILARMNRPITDVAGLVERLALFRRRFPGVGLGGDFIVGFPSETEEQFEATCSAVVAAGFCYGHVFRYSRRPGTPAASSGGQIDEKGKTARSARLREVLDTCHESFIEGARGAAQTILVEADNPVSGLASNYLRIEVPGVSVQKNTWMRVEIHGINPDSGRCVGVPAREIVFK